MRFRSGQMLSLIPACIAPEVSYTWLPFIGSNSGPAGERYLLAHNISYNDILLPYSQSTWAPPTLETKHERHTPEWP